MDIKFLIEDYERAHQDILVGRNDMSKLLQEIKEEKQQQSAESSDAHEAKHLEVNAEPPQGNILEDKELQEFFKYCNGPFIAEPHIKTHKSELLSEEKLQNLNLEECLNLLKRFEAELQQEKSNNKAAQEELEKVKLSSAEEIQKHKTELDNVRQQLKSLQCDHQKTIKEHSNLCQQELKKTKAAYEEQLQNHKEELKDFKQKYEILQRDLKKAQETIEREQPSGEAPLEQEHQTCKKDLRQKFDSFRADLKKSKMDLQSSESSLFMRGLGSMGMSSNQGMFQSFKIAETNFRSRVLSLQTGRLQDKERVKNRRDGSSQEGPEEGQKIHNKDREKADSDTELEPWNDEKKRHAKHLEVNAEPPQGNILEDKELQEFFKYCNGPFIAEPHIKTHKSELLSEEKLQNLNLEECLNLLKRFEAELQQEKSKNKAAQEELEKQLKSLQCDHQKTIKEHSNLCQQELKKTKAAYEEQLQNHKEELKDFKQKYEILQRDLKKAQETIEREQPSGEAPLEQEHQTCKKDLRQKFDSFRADLKKSKMDLQSSESSLFMRGLGRIKKETQQEKKLYDCLKKEKDTIRLAYKEQQNQLSYAKMHFESVRAQLDDYKTRSESKTEETDRLRKDRKKVKKSHNKDREKADSDTELEPWNDEKKRHGKDVSAQEGNDASELLTERKRRKKHRKNKPSTESEQKAGRKRRPADIWADPKD
ncbi:hypothetical protein D4764_0276260 [Takifugu flavidus]|uniref:Uncharacterized protein n=1 Tax=Takifugu flavidus TaxID=433684 RepID=A0A5C6MF14_9TELE|nr:hypothetical protein D4764_0276260 [Takifugu flavidus]